MVIWTISLRMVSALVFVVEMGDSLALHDLRLAELDAGPVRL